MSYIAGYNQPGYLPDSEPIVFETLEDAVSFLVEELMSLADYYAEGDDEETADALEDDAKELETMKLAERDLPFEYLTSAGEVFWIVKGPGGGN